MKTNHVPVAMVANDRSAPPVWHGQELTRREVLYQAGKVPVYDWDEVRARLEARRATL